MRAGSPAPTSLCCPLTVVLLRSGSRNSTSAPALFTCGTRAAQGGTRSVPPKASISTATTARGSCSAQWDSRRLSGPLPAAAQLAHGGNTNCWPPVTAHLLPACREGERVPLRRAGIGGELLASRGWRRGASSRAICLCICTRRPAGCGGGQQRQAECRQRCAPAARWRWCRGCAGGNCGAADGPPRCCAPARRRCALPLRRQRGAAGWAAWHGHMWTRQAAGKSCRPCVALGRHRLRRSATHYSHAQLRSLPLVRPNHGAGWHRLRERWRGQCSQSGVPGCPIQVSLVVDHRTAGTSGNREGNDWSRSQPARSQLPVP